MRKFFYLIILFFIFTISVNAMTVSGSASSCALGGATHGLVYNTNGGGSIETTMFCSACFHEDTSLPIPVKKGYEFGGWYYDSSFKQKVETNNINEVKYTQLYNENGCIKYTEVNLYAKWLKVELEAEVKPSCPLGGATYGIIYNTNGGNKIEDYVHCSGCRPKDVLLPTPSKKGYEFMGWYYDSSFKKKVSVNYANKITYIQLYDENGCTKYTKVNLYAKWKKIENKTETDKDKDKDDTGKLEKPDDTKEEVKCPVDVSLYSIKYNSNGGNAIPDYTYCADCTDDVLLPVPIKDGYDFVGWFYDYEFQNQVVEEYANKIKYDKVTDKNGCLVQTEITLYAKWSIKQNVNNENSDEVIEEKALVVFHTDGGGVFTDKKVCVSCPAATLINTPQKNGYEFVGWYYDQHYINKVNVKYLEDLSDIFTDKTEDETIINVYAKWKAVKEVKNEDNKIYGILGGIILVLVIITILVVSKKKKDNYYNY